MEKRFDHKKIEKDIYKMWEDVGALSPEGASKLREKVGFEVKDEHFSVLMPPPNANAPLHAGHATYAIQDLMARYKRMQGYKTLYLPGTDHAGFETQVVYERELKKQNKSRFDFDRETLYKDILNFVKENSEVAINQLKRIGMSADWGRNVFMLEDKVVDIVLETFEKMHTDKLIYRDLYLVNYSPYHGTTFSNLETTHKETISPLYYVKYKIKDSDETVTVATVRPETIFGDVAIAVNPKDTRYNKIVGKTAVNPLNGRGLEIIEDAYVDVEFGTGALKITPGHDFNDFEIGGRHDLEMISVIDFDGKMINTNDEIDGLNATGAREKTVKMLEENNALEKIDKKYTNNLLVDYKDEKPIEPLLMPNWFVKMDGLAKKATEVVKNESVKYNAETWKKQTLRWLEEIRDWPISRQIVFGIRIPVWYKASENPDMRVNFIKGGKNVSGKIENLLKEYSFEEIKSGLQTLRAPVGAKYEVSRESPGDDYLQETDTFDTWFSSGQWPLTTLGFSHDGDHAEDFNNFFPTSFIDSMWDILFFWIVRMIMFSLYLTEGKVPFKNVYIHGRINDEKGQKMSKSKGNVIDPLDYVEKYGADALRMGILVGGNTAARSTSFSEDKVRGYRNFANKIWNMVRFMNMLTEETTPTPFDEIEPEGEDKKILEGLNTLINNVTANLEKYRFSDAGADIYHFMWDELADKYIESVKGREDKEVALGILNHVFLTCLKLLHPFMPFVTEEVWKHIPNAKNDPLIIQNWPQEQ